MTALHSHPQYVRSPRTDSTMAGDRAAIYHRDSHKAITLNPLGTILWNDLVNPRTEDALIEILQTRWPQVSEETLQQDVRAFLESLEKHDLLIREPRKS